MRSRSMISSKVRLDRSCRLNEDRLYWRKGLTSRPCEQGSLIPRWALEWSLKGTAQVRSTNPPPIIGYQELWHSGQPEDRGGKCIAKGCIVEKQLWR
jgi:hypothetical protein